MSKIKYAAAMLAAGGAAGAAASAQAMTLVTLDLPAGASLTQYITLTSSGGSASATYSAGAQFSFGPGLVLGIPSPILSEAKFEINGPDGVGLGAESTTPEFPTAGELPLTGTKYPADFASGGVDEYLQLEFLADGNIYTGYAAFDASGDLETITFAAVPEPESWALLLAGVGVAGGALRGARRRRQRLAA
ncbi:MAG TPA: PEPxxWA-CTERM sorting domain-containing protein [Caulobacteraceae bacterium]